MKIKTIVCFALIILLVGCFVKKNDYNQEAVNKAEKVVESYLKNNYKNIETVEVDKIYKSQMGGMTADGTVNNKFEFNIGIEETDFTISSIGEGQGFPDEKEECKDKVCEY